MDERDGFLRAICADPDDDTVRLAFADWLEEHGEPERAEFIRVQCRLPGLSRRSVEAKRLLLREADLRQKLFKHLDKLPFAELVIRRGFVESVTSGLRVFAKHAVDLGAEDAPAYALAIDPDEGDEKLLEGDWDSEVGVVRDAVEQPTLRRCVSLEPRFHLRSHTAEVLFASAHLTSLRRLSASGDAGEAFEDLDSPTFANLRWLNLHGNDGPDHHPPPITRLAHSEHLANLEHLDLGQCNIGDDGFRDLATTPHLRKVKHLDLSGSRLFGKSFADFVQTKSLPALLELDLSDSFWWDRTGFPPDKATRLLADSPLIERLTKLSLWRNEITDEGASALAESPRKLHLKQLDLWANPISDETKLALEKRFGPGVCTYHRPDDASRQ